jgi:hypothetical protein
MVSPSIGSVAQPVEGVYIARSDMVLESKVRRNAASIPGKVEFAGKEEASESSRLPSAPLKINHTEARKGNSRQVVFAHVQIRSYYMTIGDNPACRVGAPVSLDWQYEELPVLTLDHFESARAITRKSSLRNLILDYYQRKEMLLDSGYSQDELKQAEKAAAKIQRQRSRTQVLLPISKIEELAQSARRKVKRRLQV